MATNAATRRLLTHIAMEGSVREIADDVFVIAPDNVRFARDRLRNQPQVLYYLDRDMRMTGVPLNGLGDKCWILHKPDVTVEQPLTERWFRKNVPLTPGRSYPGLTEYRVDVTSAHERYKNTDGSLTEYQNAYWRIDKYVGTIAMIGMVPYGPTVEVEDWSPYGLPEEYDQVSGENCRELNWFHPDNPPKSSEYQVVVFASHAFHRTGKIVQPVMTQQESDVAQVMIAGPALCEYGEFLPGYEIVMAGFPEVASRALRVVDGVKEKNASIDIVEVSARLNAMKAKKDHKLLCFRGSGAVDPLKLWSETAVVPNASFETLAADGTTITAEELKRAKTAWLTGEWMISGLAVGNDAEVLLDIATDLDGVTVTVKPSGPDEVHFLTPDGVSSFSLSGFERTLLVAVASGARVTLVANAWIDDPAFNKAAWARAKEIVAAGQAAALSELTPSPPAEGEEAPEPDAVRPTGSNMGRAVCARLLTSPTVTPKEELLLLPFMSPQYFWTKYARGEGPPTS